jgi:hypothetical protein
MSNRLGGSSPSGQNGRRLARGQDDNAKGDDAACEVVPGFSHQMLAPDGRVIGSGELCMNNFCDYVNEIADGQS